MRAAHGPVEELLAGIWARGAGRRAGGRRGQLLRARRPLAAGDAGGLAACATAFGVELPLRALFEAPTVAGLAGAVGGGAERRAAATLPPIARVPRDGALPLSFAQQRLWFLDQLEPGSVGLQHAERRCGCTGRLDVAALARSLRRSWCAGTRRCAPRFAAVDGQPVQVIHPPARCALPLIDLRRAARGGARGGAARGWRCDEARRPFDLARGPLLRAALLRLDERRARAAADDAPHRLRRLVDGRAGARAGGALRGASPRAGRRRCRSCRSSTRTSRPGSGSWLAGEVLERQLALLERAARRGAAAAGAADRPAAAGGAELPRARAAGCSLPPELAQALQGARPRARAPTLFMVLLAAFQALLAPLHRAGRRGRGHADRRPHAARRSRG